MRYVSILALWHFFFIQVHCGYWGISWRALCSHWESVQWFDGPLSLPLHVWALGAVCAMVCFVPSPPTISFTHPNHPDRSQTVLCLHQVLTLHQQWTWLGWLCPHLCLTPCSLTLPHTPCTVLWLTGFRGYAIGGLGAH